MWNICSIGTGPTETNLGRFMIFLLTRQDFFNGKYLPNKIALISTFYLRIEISSIQINLSTTFMYSIAS